MGIITMESEKTYNGLFLHAVWSMQIVNFDPMWI